MILDLLAHESRYRSAHPRFGAGFDWLKQLSRDHPLGRVDIQGDELFALVQENETAAPETLRFESHRRYIDIQYVVAGVETMLVAPVSVLQASTAYDAAKDIMFYREPEAGTAARVAAGSFAVFFPEDAHKPCCLAGPPARVRKVVVKVAVLPLP